MGKKRLQRCAWAGALFFFAAYAGDTDALKKKFDRALLLEFAEGKGAEAERLYREVAEDPSAPAELSRKARERWEACRKKTGQAAVPAVSPAPEGNSASIQELEIEAGEMVLGSGDRHLWALRSDAAKVSLIDAATLRVERELPLDRQGKAIVRKGSSVFVLQKDSPTLRVFDAATGARKADISLDAGEVLSLGASANEKDPFVHALSLPKPGSRRHPQAVWVHALRADGGTVESRKEYVLGNNTFPNEWVTRISGDGRWAYLAYPEAGQHLRHFAVLDLSEEGKVAPPDPFTRSETFPFVGDACGRFAANLRGGLWTPDTRTKAGSVSGSSPVFHPSRPLLLTFQMFFPDIGGDKGNELPFDLGCTRVNGRRMRLSIYSADALERLKTIESLPQMEIDQVLIPAASDRLYLIQHADFSRRLRARVAAVDVPWKGLDSEHPFLLAPEPRREVFTRQTWRYVPGVFGSASGKVSFRAIKGPEGLRFESGKGEFEWTPSPKDAGLFPVELEAADSAGKTSRLAFTLEVARPFRVLDTITRAGSLAPDGRHLYLVCDETYARSGEGHTHFLRVLDGADLRETRLPLNGKGYGVVEKNGIVHVLCRGGDSSFLQTFKKGSWEAGEAIEIWKRQDEGGMLASGDPRDPYLYLFAGDGLFRFNVENRTPPLRYLYGKSRPDAASARISKDGRILTWESGGQLACWDISGDEPRPLARISGDASAFNRMGPSVVLADGSIMAMDMKTRLGSLKGPWVFPLEERSCFLEIGSGSGKVIDVRGGGGGLHSGRSGGRGRVMATELALSRPNGERLSSIEIPPVLPHEVWIDEKNLRVFILQNIGPGNGLPEQRWIPRSPFDAAGVVLAADLEPGGMPPPDPVRGWPDTFAAVGKEWKYQPILADDGRRCRFRKVQAPEGFQVDEKSGRCSFTPGIGAIGRQEVELEVTDPDGNRFRHLFSLDVSLRSFRLHGEKGEIVFPAGEGPVGMVSDARGEKLALITARGRLLLVSTAEEGKTAEISLRGAILPPGGNFGGLQFVEGFFWVLFPNSGILYRIDPKTSAVEQFPVSEGADRLLVSSDRRFFACQANGKVYLVSPKDGRSTGPVASGVDAAFSFDGGILWTLKAAPPPTPALETPFLPTVPPVQPDRPLRAHAPRGAQDGKWRLVDQLPTDLNETSFQSLVPLPVGGLIASAGRSGVILRREGDLSDAVAVIPAGNSNFGFTRPVFHPLTRSLFWFWASEGEMGRKDFFLSRLSLDLDPPIVDGNQRKKTVQAGPVSYSVEDLGPDLWRKGGEQAEFDVFRFPYLALADQAPRLFLWHAGRITCLDLPVPSKPLPGFPRVTGLPEPRFSPGKEYRYRLEVAGQGPFRFQLKQGPEGMKLDGKSGELIWTPPQGDDAPKESRVVVWVLDDKTGQVLLAQAFLLRKEGIEE